MPICLCMRVHAVLIGWREGAPLDIDVQDFSQLLTQLVCHHLNRSTTPPLCWVFSQPMNVTTECNRYVHNTLFWCYFCDPAYTDHFTCVQYFRRNWCSWDVWRWIPQSCSVSWLLTSAASILFLFLCPRWLHYHCHRGYEPRPPTPILL